MARLGSEPLVAALRAGARRWVGLVWLGAALGSAAAFGQVGKGLTQSIPAEPLAQALAAYALQTGVQLIYVADLAVGKVSKGASAGLAPRAALNRLLEGTNLRFEFLNDRSVRIVLASQVTAAVSVPARLRKQAAPELPIALDQVVVTAGATPQPAFLPGSRAVLTRQAIEAYGIQDLAAFATLIPGIEFDSYPDYGAGIETNIAIRGVNALDGSTTAIYIDDVPVPGDRLSSFGRANPLTFDLDRVEVLRGPQGVLFGEGAEGGVVRFLSTAPNLARFDGLAQAEVSSTRSGADNYEAGAALGGPLVVDRVGFRISAWSRRDGGYVDRVDPFSGAVVDPDANRTRSEALRLALAFLVSDLRVTSAVEYQSVRAHDTSTFYTYLSDPANEQFRNGKLLAQGDADRHFLLSLKLEGQWGGMKVSSVSGYFRRNAAAVFDNSNDAFWFWANPLGPEYPLSYADAKPEPLNLEQSDFSQQIRLSSDPGAPFTWLAAVDYMHARYREGQDIATSALSDGGEIRGSELADRSTEQWALFGQVEWPLATRLTADLGLRIERQSYSSYQTMVTSSANLPVLVDGGPVFSARGDGVTAAPHFALSFWADDQNLLYATAAKGYRSAGANPQVGSACPIQTPASYGPDSLWNFEIGSKDSVFDDRLQITSSLFYMLWQDRQLQIPVPGCGFGYTINVGAAQTHGFELALQGAMTRHLTAKLALAFADARYLQTVLEGDRVVAVRGDTLGSLPLVPAPWSSTPSLEYRQEAILGATFSLTAWDVFRARNTGPFTTNNPNAVVYAPERRADPSTNLLNFSATLSWERLQCSMFINNALNSQPILQYRNRVPADTLFYATTFRPMTIGLNVRWQFDGVQSNPAR